ncbi:hypothetical protein HYH02_004316 [Chlamydomonas schloesseri]|uniref:Uncharacterized protein n=1 Tax=Chlamydomonas schloesseri TaxID=2026947 RepID=A0A835WNG9_9CHLO|nr:hypothetical protein HYH02_004316 [Chlamydomonas schloesseri]|eukprot:KAG2451048.1 hypothetical protein HYH02_004316 [Chlamydomonas schloesseri]
MTNISRHELELLKHSCGLRAAGASDQPAPTDDSDGLEQAAALIISGRYIAALQASPALRQLLDTTTASSSPGTSASGDAVTDAASYFGVVSARAAAAVEQTSPSGSGAAGSSSSSSSSGRLHAVLLAGVACLHVFQQHNLTGPTCDPSPPPPPPSPLDLFAPPAAAAAAAEVPKRPCGASPAAAFASPSSSSTAGGAAPAAAAAAAPATDLGAAAPTLAPPPGAVGTGEDGLGGLALDCQCLGDKWAVQELQVDGEDLVGRCPAVQWLLLARRLLVAPLALPARLASEPASAGLDGTGDGAAAAPASSSSSSPAAAAAAAAAKEHEQPREQELRRLGALLHGGPAGGILPRSWSWWALRCVMAQQHALDGRSHTLLAEASQLTTALVAPEGPWAASASSSPPLDCALAGVLYIELALAQYAYGYPEGGRQYLTRAGELLGLEPQLGGALGTRTAHQMEAKAQLVVVANQSQRAVPPASPLASSTGPAGAAEAAPEALAADVPLSQIAGLSDESAHVGNKELEGLVDESDVFAAPRLVGADGQVLDTRYSGPEQALLLGWATSVKKATSADDLQQWQVAPWVEAVLGQSSGQFMVAAAAKLYKTRHERTRTRTRERAMLHADELNEAISGAGLLATATAAAAAAVGSGAGKEQEAAAVAAAAEALAGQRAPLSWSVWFPLQVRLRRETGEHYISMGLVGAAIRVFESLELWDNVITCYRLTGKKALAEELVQRRLAVTPDDPKLWCALGDMHMDDRYYEEAWVRSGRRNTRSQRSLARNAMRRKDYPKAAGHWEAALALNPLHPEAWFSLGFCWLKAERFRQALRAFTRVTQQEPDNGEAWNNIAALWMHLGGYRPAFTALSEAVKHKRDSWQTWENYARAALASGHYQQAVRGITMALQLSGGQRLFLDVVSGLLDVLEGRPPPADAGTNPEAAAAAAAEGLAGLGPLGSSSSSSGIAAAAGGGEDESLKEDEMALGVPLMPLLSELSLTSTSVDGEQRDSADSGSAIPGDSAPASSSPSSAAAAAAAATAAAASKPPPQQPPEPLLSGRQRELVLHGLGSLLKEAVNSPAAEPATWGCLARYWAARDEAESAKEARLKQVRGLAGGTFKSDPARFTEYADASEALCRAYLQGYRAAVAKAEAAAAGGGGDAKPVPTKDLSAGRMHLRGLLRATQETFGEHPTRARLQALCDEITALEGAAIAAAREQQ